MQTLLLDAATTLNFSRVNAGDMSDLGDDLRSSFEDADYDVASVSVNRDTVKVALVDEDAAASKLRAIVETALDSESVRGLDVTREAIDGRDRMGTVVSFRRRP